MLIHCQSLLFSQEVKGKNTLDIERNPIELTVSGNKVNWQNAPLGKKLEVYSVIGAKVTEIEIKTTSGDSILHVSRGFYVLRLGDTVRKVVIR